MLKSAEMWHIFENAIKDYHREDQVDTPEQNPYEEDSLSFLLYRKNWIDTIQWHLEDLIREPNIAPSKGLSLKRRIDESNQNRTDLVEKIDDAVLATFTEVQPIPEARLNTESPAWAIDRLSILALKVYHMQAEVKRSNAEKALQEKNEFKYRVLLKQKEDLSLAIDQLLEDIATGKRIAKVYRQMKMYNDPELNPVLYKQKNG